MRILCFLPQFNPPNSKEKGQILAASLHILVVFDLGLQGAQPGFSTFWPLNGWTRIDWCWECENCRTPLYLRVKTILVSCGYSPKKTMFGPIHLIPFVGHIINCLHCIPIRPIGRWQEALVAGGAGAPMVKMCLKRRHTQKSRKYSNFTENITWWYASSWEYHFLKKIWWHPHWNLGKSLESFTSSCRRLF